MINKNLKVYDAQVLSEDEGIMAISLVDSPAIQANFVFLSEQTEIKLSIQEDKHIVTGPVLIPDKLIYRRDPDDTEYYIKFSKETIQLICMKMIQEGTVANNTLMHSTGYIKGLVPFEIYLAKDNSEWPEGSLVVSYKVTSEDLWKEIKDGTFRGFSLEGFFDLVETDKSRDLDEIGSLINSIQGKLKSFS